MSEITITINEDNNKLNLSNIAASKKILIVDDDRDILDGYKFIFECEGYTPQITCNPRDALRMIEKEEFSTVILDYMLPNIRGDELAERIREIKPWIKLVLISGYNDVEEVFSKRNLQVDGILKKPVNPEELLILMESITCVE
jgi:DNA-binding NtrC family response regulator